VEYVGTEEGLPGTSGGRPGLVGTQFGRLEEDPAVYAVGGDLSAIEDLDLEDSEFGGVSLIGFEVGYTVATPG